MTTTWVNETWPPRRALRTAHLRHWASVACLALSDAAAFAVAWLLIRDGVNLPSIVLLGSQARPQSTPIDVFAILGLAFILVRYLAGDYGRRQPFWDGAKNTTIALIVTALFDLAMIALGQGVYPVLPAALSWLFLLVALPLGRQAMRAVMSRMGIWRIPTALIGNSERSPAIHASLNGTLSLGFNVRWLVSEDPDTAPARELSRLNHIHSSDPESFAALLVQAGCEQAIVATENMDHSAEVVQRLLEVNMAVAVVPPLNRLPLAGLTASNFFGHDILLLQVRNNVRRLPYRLAKRAFDVTVSALLLLLFSPLLMVLALIVRRTDGGPSTYAPWRIGRNGVAFRCIKFRTMAVDADARLAQFEHEQPALFAEYQRTFKIRNDPRVTPIGRWLRRTSLDELPQLWNVLKGDMSLVGPRPVLQRELDEHYGPAAQLYTRTRPGMTGLWQVSGRSNTSYAERVVMDEWYILNWSFWYDIVILIQTAWIVVIGKGAV
jgi:undecaprenyl-phosphate galactose phosphotransferase